MLKTKAKSLGISFVAIAALLATGCNKTTEQERKRHSGIIRENMDTTIAPGHNFTAFVNGAWVKKTQIPADKAAYGVMSIVRDKAQENVKSIIEASAAGDFKQGSEEQKIGDLYESYMNLKARDSIGLKPWNRNCRKLRPSRIIKTWQGILLTRINTATAPRLALALPKISKTQNNTWF